MMTTFITAIRCDMPMIDFKFSHGLFWKAHAYEILAVIFLFSFSMLVPIEDNSPNYADGVKHYGLLFLSLLLTLVVVIKLVNHMIKPSVLYLDIQKDSIFINKHEIRSSNLSKITIKIDHDRALIGFDCRLNHIKIDPWYTNADISKRIEDLEQYCSYHNISIEVIKNKSVW